ncbi:MAG: YceI family protein [Saprospiraceae bacterium]
MKLNPLGQNMPIMNRFRLDFLCLIFFTVLLGVACNSEKTESVTKGQAVVNIEGARRDTVVVPMTEGQLYWEGSSLVSKHHGTVQIGKGDLLYVDSMFQGGTFLIDMKSLQALDMSVDKKIDLETHLKSPDFFDADKYPVAIFKIINVDRVAGLVDYTHKISGTLVLKGIGRTVQLHATIKEKGGKVEINSSEFEINRTDWGIKFRSGAINTAKDQLITDIIKIRVHLTADRS